MNHLKQNCLHYMVCSFFFLNIVYPGFLMHKTILCLTFIIMLIAFLCIIFCSEYIIFGYDFTSSEQKNTYKWLSRDSCVQIFLLFLSVIIYSIRSISIKDYSLLIGDAIPLLILGGGINGLYNLIKFTLTNKSTDEKIKKLKKACLINSIISILYGFIFIIILIFYKDKVTIWYNGIFSTYLFKYKYNYFDELWFLHFALSAYAIKALMYSNILLSIPNNANSKPKKEK